MSGFPFHDLRAFLQALEARGELRRIPVEVDPELEISEVCDRVVKRGGPALLFERVKGSTMPVLINALGSEARVNLALGVKRTSELPGKVEPILALLDKRPEGLLDKLKMLPKLADLGAVFPRTVKSAPCQEVVVTGDDVDLGKLPVLKCWPLDAGRFITMPMVFSRDPEHGKTNVGMYRLQIHDRKTTGMHWHQHHGGATHAQKARWKGVERIEAAAAIGGDPLCVFCAAMPLPDDLYEMIFAGFLRGKPVEMVKCRTVGLEVPATAEIVLEGYVSVNEMRREGPFGDHTGYYSQPDDYPVFHVTAVTHRRDPIYQTIIVGRPPMEDCWMAGAIEHIVLPVLQKQFPEIVDFHLPFEGIFHNLMILSIRKRYPGHARKMMHALWGTGQAMFSKVILVVDHDVDVRDYREVCWKALNHIDPERDTEFVLGPVETLDHASRLPKFGSKMGVDATRKGPDEGFLRPWPEEQLMSPEVRALVDRRWREYGLG
ncbi:MAG: menaquinone biosynthesis decarboxylase [Planctomycetota bacterium]